MRKVFLVVCAFIVACLGIGLVACGEEEVPACAHEYASSFTCQDRTCQKCNKVLAATTDHVFTETKVEATCTKGGHSDLVCACGFAKKEKETSALGHNFVLKQVVEPATCLTPGESLFDCSRCDETKTEFTQALGHISDPAKEKVVAATCTEKGYTEHTCKTCETKYRDAYADALGHRALDGSDVVIAPTCTEPGHTEHTCETCQKTYSDTEIAALGHDWDVLEKVETATCAQAAFERRSCSRCELTELEMIAAKTSHVYGEDGNCTGCKKYVTDVFAISVDERFENALQFVKADETFGYVISAEPMEGNAWYRINIDRATIDALIKHGHGNLTVRFGNPDEKARTFNWMIEGDLAPTAANNFTPNGFSDACGFTLPLTDANGVLDSRIKDFGLNVYVLYNGLSGAKVNIFALDLSFGEIVLADDPATQIAIVGEKFDKLYDAETSRWTVNGVDLTKKDNFKLWISELALREIRQAGQKFIEITIGNKEGQGLTISYDGGAAPVAGNQSLTFRVALPETGDLTIQTIYMGHIAFAGTAPNGFHLSIKGADSLS